MAAKRSEESPPAMELVSWRRTLLGVPLRNEAAGVVEEDDGLRIGVALTRPRWLVPPLSWVIKPRSERTVRLDTLGAEVWRLCDGERTVENVVDEFARRHSLTFHESRTAVTSYMKQLMQRGVLVIAAEEETGKEDETKEDGVKEPSEE